MAEVLSEFIGRWAFECLNVCVCVATWKSISIGFPSSITFFIQCVNVCLSRKLAIHVHGIVLSQIYFVIQLFSFTEGVVSIMIKIVRPSSKGHCTSTWEVVVILLWCYANDAALDECSDLVVGLNLRNV